MKKAFVLLALTSMLAACEEPFEAQQSNDQSDPAAQAVDVMDNHDRDQEQDQDQRGNGGN